uniref:Metallophosphoesterase 1 homolog n=1 Tax=Glossina morsitans morsitans TaxID=37546 RepID=A0A1B0FEQ8_GLOMM
MYLRKLCRILYENMIKNKMSLRKRKLCIYFLIVFGSIFYCEFLADYITLWKCEWPRLKQHKDAPDLRAMLLADVHLLGPINGHWLDKLYREWHMRRAFQASITIHYPDVVFILGDLFDEGYFVNQHYFREYIRRFRSYFHTPQHIRLISIAGNHDIGFHYRMQPYVVNRFKRHLNYTGIHLYTVNKVHFILINSMAMENDGCSFCKNALKDLYNIKDKLDCLRNVHTCPDMETIQNHQYYSRPIVMQHFPTFRTSDKSCEEHDYLELEEYREKWEVLSRNSTDWLGELLQPRLSFAGHSHHYCHSINRWGVDEYTLASFNWRNKINPSFLMATLTPENHLVSKCNMLEQQTVVNVYLCAIFLIIVALVRDTHRWFLQKIKLL